MMYKLSAVVLGLFSSHFVWAENSQSINTGSRFNPQISLILDGNFYHDNQKAKGSEVLEGMAGIGHGIGFGEEEAGLQNGFNLGESELVMSAIVDPYFDGYLTLTVGADGGTALEESWLQTRLLPHGLKVKMGKFLSGMGYQNSQHKHAWDFADQNLAYSGLLGGEGFKDTGVQLTWIAPTPFYALLGVEALQGSDQERFGTRITNTDAETIIASTQPLADAKAGPRIRTLFTKFAPDIGDSQALQLGLSYAQAQQYQQILDSDGTPLNGDEVALDGKQTLYGLDWVYKWDSAGEFGEGDIKITGEYLRLKKNMTISGTGASAGLMVGDAVTGSQDGYYLQASYGIAPRWLIASRYDVNGATNELNVAGAKTEMKQSSRIGVSLAFSPSEFSRLRLQLAQGFIYDDAGTKTPLKQVFLQYTHSLGAHGAHKF
ncbi:porin [Moraxellaceae bacterium AER2_44_116]|nr:hypothetical protein [Moraxellaceae bacterium]TQC98363.1 porin [Moraxellaceae bacterium AER2_44_116]